VGTPWGGIDPAGENVRDLIQEPIKITTTRENQIPLRSLPQIIKKVAHEE
jgi:hypothetical protein